MAPFQPRNPDAPVCCTCGTQYPSNTSPSFTTLSSLLSSDSHYHNVFTPLSHDPEHFISIHTEPKVAIGQRAILVRTPAGNVLWDCITYLDDETVEKIKGYGDLVGIVISHPHYYSTHVEWANAFECPVYLAAEDKKWIAVPLGEHQSFLDQTVTSISGKNGQDIGVKALKLGGHFPGSLVLLYDGRLLLADTLMTTPAGMGKWNVDAKGNTRNKPPGLNSFSFMWSIPNMIPLNTEEIVHMWDVLKNYDFRSSHGAFTGQDIEDEGVKGRVLESMQIQIRHMGYPQHALLKETI
ncbi:hypothetical protein DL546_008381 [Coniochaeta pulveracea]|uniref:Metallo-beta-lactamase domain-containing protein n=1 Tax=Coniochaeta pulveracea TaxID=177199 RepID=A0A420YKB6_9PEZI|nr:hypothetical protein DL546_008381 [Coniochaeta pulveracea]